MTFNLKSRIWLTVFFIVIMFTFFTLYYFPEQQRKALLQSYNTEVQNLANSVALGVTIALTDQNFENLGSAIQLVKDDSRLKFVSMVQCDTIKNQTNSKFEVNKTIFRTYPENENPDPFVETSNDLIVKRGTFNTPVLSGEILLAFTTRQIAESEKEIRITSSIVSGFVLIVGLLLGLLLARKISVPVLALRDASRRVGEGDLSQKVNIKSSDEIGELGIAFNKMVEDLSDTKKELDKNYKALGKTISTLKNTVAELKSTQTQLIHAEKMASLGELTAGIAHEIQNPLNFVNNFSEINTELIDEAGEEMSGGNIDEVKAILNNIKENEQKINHHGKRAEAIVKGMLLHSRGSSGQKEPTDINTLCDEYLRLSYHGFRAKDKSFNVDFKLETDESMPKIEVAPQDVGRVLLNLINNAFYAVNEKLKQNVNDFKPMVVVNTKLTGNKVEIKVQDNGNGVPESVKEKIFQPFFTTKPTGQGTGLGLSLSYDIIKAHGGSIQLNSQEKEGTEFIIHLPIG